MFYFTADGRVDFRELVKDLAGIFHTRIELRQIGVRDESKMIGGLGICGQPFCCSRFFKGLPACFHQDGEGAGAFSQSHQDKRGLRPADVLPCLRGERLRVPEQHHAHGGQHGAHPDGLGTVLEVNPVSGYLRGRCGTESLAPPLL